MPSASEQRRSDRQLADIAALADGSLPASERAQLEARVAADPELRRLVGEQRTARAAVRAAVPLAAPSGLRRRLEAAPASRAARSRRALGAVAVTAIVVAALVLSATIGPTGGPSVVQAAALAARSPAAPAPQPRDGRTTLPGLRGAALPYPNWRRRFGWRAVGVRHDRIAGRAATTVFYRKAGRQVGYTIVAGAALARPPGAAEARRSGTMLYGLHANGRAIVTWQRRHRTCVLSGVGVPRRVLLALGAWKDAGSIPY